MFLLWYSLSTYLNFNWSNTFLSLSASQSSSQETCCRPLEHFVTFLPPSANFLFLCHLSVFRYNSRLTGASPQRTSWQFIEVSMGVTQIPNLPGAPWLGPAHLDRCSFTSTCTSWQLQSNQLRHCQNHQMCHGGLVVEVLLAWSDVAVTSK